MVVACGIVKYERMAWDLASYHGRTEIVRLLLERGASAEVRNDDGKTPLQVALEEGDHEIV